MGLYKKNFEIAGINIQIQSEEFFDISDKYKIFEKDTKNIDITMRIESNNDIDISKYNNIYSTEEFDIMEDKEVLIKVKYVDYRKKEIDWCLLKQDKNTFILYLVKENKQRLNTFNFLYFLEISLFLIQYDAMILHASVVNYKNNAILFTAPSGTGKSTQASLWEKYRYAEILNGDRAIIRKQESGYNVYGSPFAGSSNIYINKYAKLKAIIVLRQAKKNKLIRLSHKNAYMFLLSELSISPWNKQAVDKQTKWLLKLINDVPIYMLECLPNKNAVEIVYNELEGNDYGK